MTETYLFHLLAWFTMVGDIADNHLDRSVVLELGISYNTLRTQLTRLCRKLRVQSRIGVAVAVFSEAMRIVAEEQAEQSVKSSS